MKGISENTACAADLIQIIAQRKSNEIYKNGCAAAGCNGPYKCKDTNIRNTAHWICIYKYLWKKTKQEEYKDIIKILADYLSEDRHYGKSGAIHCMDAEKMDHLNGSIGQGWAIEGLAAAYECCREKLYLQRAIQIFKSQRYDFKEHIWERVELDGTNIGPDRVFNHQLWFAADSAMLLPFTDEEEIRQILEDFVENVENLFDVYHDGLLKHYIIKFDNVKNIGMKKRMKRAVKKAAVFLRVFDQRFDHKSFERAYHLFDLYGFALLYEAYPNAAVFKSSKFKRALSYGLDIKTLNKKLHASLPLYSGIFKYNQYAYAYNSPAFEYPYVDFIFDHEKNAKVYEELWALQLQLTYDENRKKFANRTSDPETLTARLYELTHYLERKV